MHMESICTRTFFQSHHSILNSIHFTCMIWIYIAENGIMYLLMYSTFCYASKFGPPPFVYWQPVSHIWDTDWQHRSQPIWILNSILLMYYYVKARPMPLEFFTCCVGWWCEVLKWLLMMLTHKCQNSRTMPLTKAFFFYYITKQCLQYDIELRSLYVVKAYFLYHSLHHYIAWREKESSAHCPTCQISH